MLDNMASTSLHTLWFSQLRKLRLCPGVIQAGSVAVVGWGGKQCESGVSWAIKHTDELLDGFHILYGLSTQGLRDQAAQLCPDKESHNCLSALPSSQTVQNNASH